MTICIAASCEVGADLSDEPPPSIVICADMQLTSSVAAVDVAFKSRFLVGSWHLSYAGNVTEEHATSRHIRSVFADNQFRTIDETNIASLMEEAYARRKREHARSIAIRDWGLPLRKVRRMARQGIQPAIDTLQEIRSWRPECEVDYIVSGVSHGLAYMLEFNDGVPVWRDEWAIVGDAQGAADAVLQRRAQSPVAGLTRTIIGVYEAKKAAEAATTTIGPKTVICVQREDRPDPLILKEEYIQDVIEPVRITARVDLSAPLPELPPPTADAYYSISA